MREIKFRGRCLDGWLYGESIWFNEFPTFNDRQIYMPNPNDENCDELNIETWSMVIDVCQYIGLKDKNGKEIYEGDIVKFMDEETIYSDCGYEYNEFINTGKVIFNKELMGWDITNRNMDLEEVWHYSEYIEVIGNVYENKDLLAE